MNYFNIRKIYRIITVMGVVRLEDALSLRTARFFSLIIITVIGIIARNFPLRLIRFMPKSICALMSSSSLVQNLDQERCFIWAENASKSKYSGHRKVGFYIKMSFAFSHFSETNFRNFVNEELQSEFDLHEKRDFYKVWSFHNIGQYQFSKFVSKSKVDLENTDLLFSPESKRYLPEHTTNMGHLANLFLYANYYRHTQPERKIVIWPDISPNNFYLKNLLEIFPLKFSTKTGQPLTSELRAHEIDTLIYSRVDFGKWRYESGVSFPCSQDFPEYSIKEDFVLRSNNKLDEFALSKLRKIGFDENKWFITLHVKEHVRGFKFGGETRDADINSYKMACQLVSDMGGQVVRMGGTNFPKLEVNFPAIDYAHSTIRSEQIDYWLWANCKFWIGNGNGASFAIITFGKPRLVTNVWPINPFGPKNDFYIPKLIFNKANNSYFTPKELIEHKLSRSMKKELFKSFDLELLENSPIVLRDATLEMFDKINNKMQISQNYLSSFENEINEKMYAVSSEHIMQIPKSFNNSVQFSE